MLPLKTRSEFERRFLKRSWEVGADSVEGSESGILATISRTAWTYLFTPRSDTARSLGTPRRARKREGCCKHPRVCPGELHLAISRMARNESLGSCPSSDSPTPSFDFFLWRRESWKVREFSTKGCGFDQPQTALRAPPPPPPLPLPYPILNRRVARGNPFVSRQVPRAIVSRPLPPPPPRTSFPGDGVTSRRSMLGSGTCTSCQGWRRP